MRRICCLSDYSTPVQTDRLRVSPPVFATPTDAWHHFIRHPDDYPLSDEDEYDDSFDRQCDVFDRMDSFFNLQLEVPAEQPLAVAAEDEESGREEPSDERKEDESNGE